MRFLRTVVLLAAAASALHARGEWTLDRSHSSVGFAVRHLMIAEVRGSFKNFDLKLTADKSDFSDLKLEGSIQTASISTDNERRDAHLRSADFFDAEKYPAMSFRSDSVTRTGDNRFAVEGDLTIRDVTRRVTWEIALLGTAAMRGKTVSAWKGSVNINRFDYNLTWDRKTEAGGLVVGETVTVTVTAEFVN